MSDDLRDEVRGWLNDNWDAELSVREWWERLAESGWGFPTWPTDWFGKGLGRADARIVGEEFKQAGALGAPGGLGSLLAAPTIMTHGSEEQKERFLPDIATGRAGWCQLFSEPEAGSDLAGLRTSAVQDGDEWIVSGQKVWTSGGHQSNLGMLIARTDPTVAKHAGITYFAIEMDQPGIDVRPLKEMTGKALFNEVFLDEARVADADMIGGLGNGWAVANTTLAAERAGLGAGGGGGTSAAIAGSKVGHLDRPAGEFVKKSASGTSGGLSGQGFGMLTKMAQENGSIDDPNIRQSLMRLYTLEQLGRMGNVRMKAMRKANMEIHPSMPNIAKLSQSDIVRQTREIGLQIMGAAGTLWGDSAPDGGVMAELAVFSPGPSIYGGTDQVQRNIIGERGLGLPQEPRPDKGVPFNEI